MDGDRQCVIIQLGTGNYALDISAVQEIIRLPALTPVPKALPYVEGIINLRGSIVPVLDLRRRCGLPAEDATAATRVVVVQTEQHRLGLIVDRVVEVSTIPACAVEPVTGFVRHERARHLLLGVARMVDRLVLVLDLAQVIPQNAGSARLELANAGL